MLTIIWNFVKPYVSNVFVWVGLVLIIALAVQTFKCYTKDNKIQVLSVQLTGANDKLVMQDAEFKKLKLIADALDGKLKTAYEENVAIAKANAKSIEAIINSELPDTASCEDTAKWAREIARRKK
jgi:fructose-1-phosphate kinase PfkB-like protein